MFGKRLRLQVTGRLSAQPPRGFDVLRLALAVPPVKRPQIEVYCRLTDPADWFSEEDRAVLPPLFATRFEPDPIARIKLFASFMDCSWYVMEFDGGDQFFGFFRGMEAEIGYFSINDLRRVGGFWGSKVERDPYFEPTPLSLLLRGVR